MLTECFTTPRPVASAVPFKAERGDVNVLLFWHETIFAAV